MNKAELKKVIVAQSEVQNKMKYVHRDKETLKSNPFISIVAGVRRCGKSTLIDYYRKQNAEKQFAINFDDNRLTEFSVDDFEKLYEAFNELFNPEKTWYLDEIQIIKGWERFVRRLYNEGHKVYITGSNATMSSAELGTHLTGRYTQTELFPFSFNEFLKFREIQLKKNDLFSQEKTNILKKAFREFVKIGGFPDYLQTENQDYLKSFYENIIYKDVVARYNIKNTKTLVEMVHFLISNIAKEASYNSLKNVFSMSNANTVKEHISYFENSYLLFSINKFDYSLKKQLANPKKIYCIDTGLANVVSFQFSENFGRQLENVVFLQLRRNGTGIYYHKNKHECDFIVTDSGKVVKALQVCQSLENPATRKREINGLIEAMRNYKLSEGLIITEDEEDVIVENETTIQVIPVWKWLLGYEGENPE